MTLYRKSVLLMVLTTTAVALTSFVVARIVLMPALLAYEEQNIEERIGTLQSALERAITDLDSTASDYAAWNRTYEYMAHPDPDFARIDISDQSFEKYDIQLVMLIGLDDNVRLLKRFELGKEAAISTGDSTAIRAATHEFIVTVRDGVGLCGVVAAPSGPYIVAMRPIVRTGGVGSSRGMFVAARRIDGNELDYIRRIVHAPVRVVTRTEGEKSRSEPGMTELALNGAQAWFQRSSSQVDAYLQVLDLNGRPAGVLRLTTDRELYYRSRRVIWSAAVLLAGIAVLLGLGKLWFLYALILRRVRDASRAVRKMMGENDLSIRFPITHNDELGMLAGAVNGMLEELERSRQQLLDSNAAAQFDANHDALTGLHNRRAIMAALQVELNRAAREHRRVAVMLADIDHFKQINDQHGHIAGDAVLKAVAVALDSELRPYDFAGRYGGEEFLLIVPGVSQVRALDVAERLRMRVYDSVRAEGAEQPVTISVGVTVTTGEDGFEEVIAAADRAMYAAKRRGRNRVELTVSQRQTAIEGAAKEYSGA